jgi:predicted metal-binding protein
MARKQAAKKRSSPGSQEFVKKARKLGALGAKLIDPSNVDTDAWVRWKCQFGCGGFGSSLVCPPHTPTPDETRKMLDGYKRAVLFESPPGKAKQIAAALEREIFLSGRYKALGLGSGPCRLCEECALDEGCRHPREARPSMEACGIDVYATARKHGFTINVVRERDDPQHYFGLVLIE